MSSLYLGTQGWSYPSWVGPFYPSGTSSKGFLDYYATQFNTVELDNTFYASPRQSAVEGWRDKTPAGFRFAAKFPQRITHEKGLVDAQHDAASFVEAISGLDDKLGVLLMQMPPQWSAASFADLETFLAGLPSGVHYALEVRHKSWLAKDTFPRLTALLERHSVALCLVQHAWMPALDTVTAPFTYVRWLGRREDIPDDDFSHVRINRDLLLDKWAEQIHRYTQQGLVVFAYFNNHFAGHSPASARMLQQRLATLDPDASELLTGEANPPPDRPGLFDLEDHSSDG